MKTKNEKSEDIVSDWNLTYKIGADVVWFSSDGLTQIADAKTSSLAYIDSNNQAVVEIKPFGKDTVVTTFLNQIKPIEP